MESIPLLRGGGGRARRNHQNDLSIPLDGPTRRRNGQQQDHGNVSSIKITPIIECLFIEM